jgi:hypothetical protein
VRVGGFRRTGLEMLGDLGGGGNLGLCVGERGWVGSERHGRGWGGEGDAKEVV